jgi:hypothetical protein
LAVDNFNGTQICGNLIKVDHVKEYKLSFDFTTLETSKGTGGLTFKPTGPDGRGWAYERKLIPEEIKHIQQQSERIVKEKTIKKKVSDDNLKNKEKIKYKLLDNVDERWENAFMKTVNNMRDKGVVTLEKQIEETRKQQEQLKQHKKIK